MTAPLVTPSRDALAEALHDLACGCAEPGEHSYALADALLASGVVRAADTLADDEALVKRAQDIWWEQGGKGGWPNILRAVAVALEESR